MNVILHSWADKMMLRGRKSMLEREELLEQGCFINAWTSEKIAKVGHDQYRLIQYDGSAPYLEGKYSTFTSELLYLMPLDNGWFWYEYNYLPTTNELDTLPELEGIKEYTFRASVPFLLGYTRNEAKALSPLVAQQYCIEVLEGVYGAYTWSIQLVGLLVLVHFVLVQDDDRDIPAPTGNIPDWSVM